MELCSIWLGILYFNPRAPCGARPAATDEEKTAVEISTHAPLAGRDTRSATRRSLKSKFQPTRPLRGATEAHPVFAQNDENFNPRAPCGARHRRRETMPPQKEFQPTRPLRGATISPLSSTGYCTEFQPTRPLRGATTSSGNTCCAHAISTHAPLAGRDERRSRRRPCNGGFQPTRPLRGATS